VPGRSYASVDSTSAIWEVVRNKLELDRNNLGREDLVRIGNFDEVAKNIGQLVAACWLLRLAHHVLVIRELGAPNPDT